jgi:hypothetical protein
MKRASDDSAEVAAATWAQRARTVPLARPAIEAFAKELPGDAPLDRAVRVALDVAAIHAAQVLALAASVAGRPLARETVAALLPELDMHEYLPAVARTCGKEAGSLLAEMAAVGTLGLEATVLAVYLAAQWLDDPRASRPLVVALRALLRRELYEDERELLVEAIRGAADPVLLEQVPAARAPSKESARVRERVLGDILGCLPDEAPLSTISGYTYRKHGAEPGRNDPCPCGSGQKYKKCHGRTGAEASAVPSISGFSDALLEPGAAARLKADQFAQFRPAELSRFDPGELTEAQLVVAFDKLLAYRRWDPIERIVGEMTRRQLRPAGMPVENFVRDLAVTLARAGETDRAARMAERAGAARGEVDLHLALARRDPGVLERLEAAAAEGLAGDIDRVYDVAFSLLEHSPALGVLVARGSFAPGRNIDNESLLLEAEVARDRLGAPPEEPYWSALDAMWGEERAQDDAQARRRRGAGVEVASQEVDRMREEMAEARARAHEAERELRERERGMHELQEKHRELEALVARTGAEDHARRVDDLEAERQRLRGRIEELKANLKEGAEQRRELRQRLTERSERARPARPEGDAPEPVARESEADEEGEAFVERKRPLRVPVFAESVKKHLEDLPLEVASASLACAAALAAGSEPTWREVKRLQRAPDALSARVGIHHRLLFRARADAIEVIDVVHRRDLPRAIDRLM